jgi:hypothetical protein
LIIRIAIVIDDGIVCVFFFFALPVFGKHFMSFVVAIDCTIGSDCRVAANTTRIVFAGIGLRVEGFGTVCDKKKIIYEKIASLYQQ